jgi:hypothetical protein
MRLRQGLVAGTAIRSDLSSEASMIMEKPRGRREISIASLTIARGPPCLEQKDLKALIPPHRSSLSRTMDLSALPPEYGFVLIVAGFIYIEGLVLGGMVSYHADDDSCRESHRRHGASVVRETDADATQGMP